MKKTIIIGLTGILVITNLIFICNCVKKESGTKIGTILPLSGDVSVYGKSLQKGMNLALEKYKNQNTNGLDIKLIYEDSKADPKLAVTSLEKLLAIDKCKIILGGFSSSEVLSMAPIAEKNKIVLISPTASSPDITNAGDYIFRTTPSDNFDGEIMAKFAYNELKLNRVAIIFSNNDYGIGISNIFKENFEQLGGNIVITKSFESGINDFKTQLVSIKNKNPDGLYIIAASEIGNILKQKTELGIESKIFTVGLAENPKVLEIAGKGANNVYYSYPSFQVDSSDEIVKTFVSDYKTKYGNEPNVLDAYGYDLFNIVLTALKKDSKSSEGIKNALYEIKNFNGVTGQSSFDENGDVTKTAGIKVIQNGEFKWFIKKFK